MGVRLADAVLAQPFGPVANPEIGEVLADPGPLDEPDVVAEMVADREEGVLPVDAVVVPRGGSFPGQLATAQPGRPRSREKPVEAQRLDEPEVRVDAGNLVAVGGCAR